VAQARGTELIDLLDLVAISGPEPELFALIVRNAPFLRGAYRLGLVSEILDKPRRGATCIVLLGLLQGAEFISSIVPKGSPDLWMTKLQFCLIYTQAYDPDKPEPFQTNPGSYARAYWSQNPTRQALDLYSK